MVILTLNVFSNSKAKDGEPTEWISLKELWLKAHYRIPYNRWVKYTCRNHNVQPRTIKRKTGGRGKPSIIYYVPVADSVPMLESIERRKNVTIKLNRKQPAI